MLRNSDSKEELPSGAELHETPISEGLCLQYVLSRIGQPIKAIPPYIDLAHLNPDTFIRIDWNQTQSMAEEYFGYSLLEPLNPEKTYKDTDIIAFAKDGFFIHVGLPADHVDKQFRVISRLGDAVFIASLDSIVKYYEKEYPDSDITISVLSKPIRP